MDLLSVYSALETANSLRAFIFGEMVNILEELGYVQYQTAILALKNARISKNPSREFESAITSLRTSYEAFYTSAARSTSIFEFISPIDHAFLRQTKGYWRAFEASTLVAICYAYLQESKLVDEYFERAEKCFYSYYDITMENAKYDDIHRHGGGWSGKVAFKKDKDLEEFNKLCQRVRGLLLTEQKL